MVQKVSHAAPVHGTRAPRPAHASGVLHRLDTLSIGHASLQLQILSYADGLNQTDNNVSTFIIVFTP